MVVQAFAFYLFAGILVLSALMVITARNPVHSVLFLVLAFFNAAGIFVLLGAEFIAMILVIVYVGAVAVLFLFVVMMLDIDFSNLRKGAMHYVPVGIAIGSVLLFELVTLYTYWVFDANATGNISHPLIVFDGVTNAQALGLVLYTDYVLAFQLSGLILFVAMVGSIVLTLRTRPGVRKQKVSQQHACSAKDVLEIKKVTSGAGV